MGFDELFGSRRVLLFSGHVLFAGMAFWGRDAQVKEAHDRGPIWREVLDDLGVVGHSKRPVWVVARGIVHPKKQDDQPSDGAGDKDRHRRRPETVFG